MTFCIAIVIWFGGWAVRTRLDVLKSMNYVEYENTLYVLMCLTVLFGCGLTVRKSKGRIERPDVNKKVKTSAQKTVDLDPINKRLDVLEEKVADIHVVITFLKNLKEKNGEPS